MVTLDHQLGCVVGIEPYINAVRGVCETDDCSLNDNLGVASK
jgi:hypothetical protein